MQSMRSQGGEKILQVLVPTEKEKEIKGGKRREVDRKIYPGYVLVEMIMEDDSWYVVRNTPGVTGFVGSGTRPVPLDDQEVKKLLKQLRDETPKYRITFQKGSQVRITSGPFMDFTGVVDEVIRGRILGREPRATIDAVRMGRKKMFVTSAKAALELGWNTVAVDDALRRAVEWFRGNGYA